MVRIVENSIVTPRNGDKCHCVRIRGFALAFRVVPCGCAHGLAQTFCPVWCGYSARRGQVLYATRFMEVSASMHCTQCALTSTTVPAS